MKKHEQEVVTAIGKAKYDEETKTLQKLIDLEAKQGKFVEVKGDVDERAELEDSCLVRRFRNSVRTQRRKDLRRSKAKSCHCENPHQTAQSSASG